MEILEQSLHLISDEEKNKVLAGLTTTNYHGCNLSAEEEIEEPCYF